MKVGLVGFPGSGKSTVFGALTGLAVETGYGARDGKAHVGTVKVPDPRVDALARLYEPKKTTYAEVVFRDVALRGFWLAPWYRTAPPEQVRALNTMLAEKLMAGELDVPVDGRYPLSEVHAAVAHAAQGGRDGKILLVED